MSWYLQWSDSIKKRACRYLLQRYLGQFIEEKLTLDQLSVNICCGTGSVSNVCLDVQALNDLGGEKNLPIEFVDGFISDISLSVPWTSLFTDSIFVEVTGMHITIQPKQRPDNAGSMLESVWNSMASSIQLAAECLKHESASSEGKEIENDNSLEGLEIFAYAIESILTRVKIKLVDTCIRLEHLPKEGKNGIAVVIKLKHLEYCDETSCEWNAEMNGGESSQRSSFATKKFHCDGITFFTDEFPLEGRTFSRSVILETGNKISDKNKDSSGLILIGKLSGFQKISVKLKLDHSAHGPKVDLEFNLGSFTFFLSPRQLYLLVEMIQSLASPHTEDTSNVPTKKGVREKLMNSRDFKKVEQDLQETLNFPNLHSHYKFSKSAHGKGWSSPLDGDEEFLPMKLTNLMSGSAMSDTQSVSSHSSSVFYGKDGQGIHDFSFQVSNPIIAKKHDRDHSYDSEGLEETSAFHIRLTSLAVILLHEDVLTFGMDTCELTPSSVSTMKNLSNQFFDRLGKFTFSGNKDFEASKGAFLKCCSLNHIRLLGATILIEGNEGGNFTNSVFSAIISAASLEVLECLVENNTISNSEQQFVELLKFMKDDNCDEAVSNHFPLTNQPDIRLHILHNKRHYHSKRTSKIELSLSLEQCWSEVDLSIFDRISTIINVQSLCRIKSSCKEVMDQQSSFSHAIECAALCEKQFFLKIQSPFLVIKFRFPIPDLRPAHEKGRFPWWQRSVRKDILFVTLLETSFYTDVNFNIPLQEYHLGCKDVVFLFKEGNSGTAIPFIQASNQMSNAQTSHSQESSPRLLIRLHPLKITGDEEETQDKEDNSGLSCSSFMDTTVKDPTPFMSKKMFFSETDTSHRSTCDGEELIIPGLKKDVSNFIACASEDAKIQIEITLPYLCIEFQSKHFYEIIYNRITSDLSLWQTSVPSRHTLSSQHLNSSSLLNPSFSMCKSGLQCDSDYSDDESLDFKSTLKETAYSHHNQSNLSLVININKGVLDVCPNLKDTCGNISTDKIGEMYFDLSEAKIFAVTFYKGKPQQNYVCLQASSIEVYHKPDIIISKIKECSKFSNLYSPPEYLEPVLKQSKKEILITSMNPEGTTSDMFSAAISTEVNERRMKTIRITCSFSNATLRHRVTCSNHSWLTQFMDFFDVVDYPVKGYDSPQVITELYVHLWDSAIDYRPLNLPLSCVITLGNLSISSNIAARTKTSKLRFIAEKVSLFISDKNKSYSTPPNLQADYVSVIQLGLFELSLRLSDQSHMPKVELKASNNVLHIRTCSDSAYALAQLITYYASEGDLKELGKNCPREMFNETESEKQEHDDISVLSESAVHRVNDMMEDAMKEICGNANELATNNIIDRDNCDVEVFYFPGEGNAQNHQTVDWGDCNTDVENDFCLLEHDSNVGFIPENGRPEVRILSDKPVQIIENHFSIAIGKTDQLVSPKYYPTPTYKYTLSDMNFVWHMYGGNDFAASQIYKKNVVFSPNDHAVQVDSSTGKTKVSTGKNCMTEKVVESNSSQTKGKQGKAKSGKFCSSNWQQLGGPGREHNVLMELQFNKVKFQHEIYPERAVQASRQVLLIHEFEIRDKLSLSQINKFLYLYCSEANPRQSHANMVVIKAVHLRPDTRRNVQETCLKVSLLPLRLNIDQDSLQFLVNFFSQLSGLNSNDSDVVRETANAHPSPIMGISGEKYVSECPLEMDTEFSNSLQEEKLLNYSKSSPIFIRNFIFTPDVPIRIDYVGKHVDLTHGPLAGLLMGLGQLSCLQIKLKKLSYKNGLLGFDKLFTFAITEWIRDIKKTQFPCLIGGVGPMHALVQLFRGIRDLFWLPIEQYQKDGRIVRGLQRGANSFMTSTAIAALELTAKIVQAIQSLAEAAFDMVSPGPSVRRINDSNNCKKQLLFSHPADIREGVANAYTLVKEGIGETAETLVRVASAEAEQKGAVGAVGGVLRQIPPIVVAPIILASAATSNLLGGVRSQLAPDTRKEATYKWKMNLNDCNDARHCKELL